MNSYSISGMFYGLVMGDALGMPHEFCRKKNQGLDDYSDLLVTTTYTNRWQGSRSTTLGQGSDDSEMSFTLYDCLKKNNYRYDKDKIILSYLNFAAHSSFLGKNTIALFKGIKTISGYKKRALKHFSESISQSNGSLMRISPLVFCTSLDPQ